MRGYSINGGKELDQLEVRTGDQDMQWDEVRRTEGQPIRVGRRLLMIRSRLESRRRRRYGVGRLDSSRGSEPFAGGARDEAGSLIEGSSRPSAERVTS